MSSSIASGLKENKQISCDICVIGAGSGGLTVAAGAAQMGADVVLIEKGEMGGDCLNTGCVPSKALLAAAEKAHTQRNSAAFGVRSVVPQVDWQAVHRHVHEVVAAIAPNDSVERFEGLGVRVIRAVARFVDARTVEAGDQQVRAKYFVLATGSSPFVPPIEGLERIDYFTNENIFANNEPIKHLIVVGSGPIGLEMAQAHRRLGAEVTVIEAAALMAKDDPELAAVVIEALRDEGIRLFEKAEGLSFGKSEMGIVARFDADGEHREVTGSHLLVATGRRANVDGLNLSAAGIDHSPRGVAVDARLRSSNYRVFAVGDVAGPYQFTHMAAYQAGIVIRNILFRLPAKADYSSVPWVTYTDPELAHVGMSEIDAERAGIRFRVLRWRFEENDRAQAERRVEGRAKVIVARNGRILGATIVGLHAGELIQPWILAVSQKMKIGAMAGLIAPYPTLAEVNKRIAGSYYTDKLFSERVRRVVRFLMRLA